MKSKSFTIFKGSFPGCAELSELDYVLISPIPTNDRPWFYFNRLFVNQKIRRMGVATDLMTQVINWADTEKFNIFIEINPYGDLDFDQLVNFYKKFGFTQQELSPVCLIRLFNS